KETAGPGNGVKSEPLPWAGYAALGGWLAWWLFETRLTAALEGMEASDLLVTLSPCLLVVLGALAGRLLTRPLNALLTVFFRGFNALFRRATNGYTGAVGKVLHLSG